MLMGFFAFVNFFTLRVNLSVAIVDMVNLTYLRQIDHAAAASSEAVNLSSLSSDVGGGQRLNSIHEPPPDTDDNSTVDDDDENVSIRTRVYQ